MKHISETLPTISATTGPTGTEETKPTLIGRELGKPGLGANLPVPFEQLTDMRPLEIDKAMADWFPRSVVTSIRPVISLSDDPGLIGETVDWRIEGNPDRSEAEQSLARLDAMMQPAPFDQVQFELGKLRALTAAKKEDGENQQFILAAFAEQIDENGYPLDVVRQACRDSANYGTFWPAWSEFKQRCDRYFLKRKAWYLALRRYLSASTRKTG